MPIKPEDYPRSWYIALVGGVAAFVWLIDVWVSRWLMPHYWALAGVLLVVAGLALCSALLILADGSHFEISHSAIRSSVGVLLLTGWYLHGMAIEAAPDETSLWILGVSGVVLMCVLFVTLWALNSILSLEAKVSRGFGTTGEDEYSTTVSFEYQEYKGAEALEVGGRRAVIAASLLVVAALLHLVHALLHL